MMKHSSGADDILSQLCKLPRKILSLQGHDNVTEFVLHDLCNERCFNFNKAAYFVDNPDFNCFKGIAGFSREEQYPNEDIWVDANLFSSHMKNASFNQKVRNFTRESLMRTGEKDSEVVQEIAQELGLKNHAYCSWNMKHENHGLLIYQASEKPIKDKKEQLFNGVCLLSFCPIF
jgi:hypothetical protein